MNKRKFGKTGRMVTEIGLGTWQLETAWPGETGHGTSSLPTNICLSQG